MLQIDKLKLRRYFRVALTNKHALHRVLLEHACKQHRAFEVLTILSACNRKFTPNLSETSNSTNNQQIQMFKDHYDSIILETLRRIIRILT